MSANQSSLPTTRVKLARTLVVVLGLVLWFGTQSFLGARALPPGDSSSAGEVLSGGDALFSVAAPLHQFLLHNPAWANGLLILSSLILDALAVFLLVRAIVGPSFRPFVGLMVVFALRQASQALCALPPPTEMIWHDPGFPSLLVTYSVANDFFFSGHTAIAVYGATELARLRHGWAVGLGVAIALFEAVAVITLRAHYTMDVFAAVVVALWVATLVVPLASWCDRLIEPRG